MSEFTPGPYIAEVTEDGQLVITAPNAADDYYRRVAYIGDMETTTGQDHYTADLLAAAPELLQSLEAFIKDERIRQLAASSYSYFDMWNAACAAIAKARGETTL